MFWLRAFLFIVLFTEGVFNSLVHMTLIVLKLIPANGKLRAKISIVAGNLKFFRVVTFFDRYFNVSEFVAVYNVRHGVLLIKGQEI